MTEKPNAYIPPPPDDFCCPYCGEPLALDDQYGRFCAHQDGQKCGDIYACLNEDAECYRTYWHLPVGNSELIEGYPC